MSRSGDCCSCLFKKKRIDVIVPENIINNCIVFVNPKSGGQRGGKLYEKLKNYFKKEQLFDLSNGGPKIGLEAYKNVEGLKILVAGGDGSVGWVLSEIDKMDLTNQPSVAILPLGTGNDLARTLNWGGGYKKNESIDKILDKVINGSIVQLDRWEIKATCTNIENNNNTLENENKPNTRTNLPLNVINNYFSIGADAKVALDFHNKREKNPKGFTNQKMNKITYAKTYLKDVFVQSCKNLKDDIELFECDGIDMLPKLKEHKWHSILLLNIPNYASGKNPWKTKRNGEKQSYSDSKLEIIGFHTLDFMFLQLGILKCDNITQASTVRIKTKKIAPMQIDGEPVLMEPVNIEIKFKKSASMIQADFAQTGCMC